MYCKHCGRDLPDDAQFCSGCGNPQSDVIPPVENEKLKKKKKKKTHPVLGTILLVISIFIIMGTLASEAEPAQPELSKSDYIAKCTEIDYAELARNPDSYKGEYFTFTGEVIQVLESGRRADLRVNVTPTTVFDSTFYSDTIYVTVTLPESGDRILMQDIITIYGICDGLYTYNAILGTQVSIPRIDAAYWEIAE